MSRRAGLIALVAAGILVLGLDRLGGQGGLPNLEAVPAVARTLAAALVLFAVSGLALTARILPPRLRDDAALFVLPVGAVAAGLALTALCVLGLALGPAIALVLGAGAVAALVERRRGRLAAIVPSGNARARTLQALAATAAVAAVTLSPMLRDDSFATVFGQNGDAHLATGTATLLQHAGPAEVAPELPVDRMPGAWKSKYPIYYTFAAVAELAGLDPVESFMALSALLLALTALGFFLLARHMLGASTGAALAALALVGLGEQALTLVYGPFYNQLWGSFALPFTLLGTWIYLTEPSRGSLALAAMFGLVGFLAYPLLAPFTAMFALICGTLVLRRRRGAGGRPGWISALRLPRGRRWLPAYAVAGIFGLFFAIALAAAGAEKVVDGIAAALPGGDLEPWSGEALSFLELARALGVSSVAVLGPVLLLLACVALARRGREVAIPLAVTAGGLLLAALYLRLRDGGQLFVFKALSFSALIVVALAAVAVVEQAASKRREIQVVAIVLGVVIAGVVAIDARRAMRDATPHLTRDLAEIEGWSADLPPRASVRVDIRGYGRQQWAWYMLADRPVTSSAPLADFFPYAPVGRKADFLLVDAGPRPADAAGAPVRSNASFGLYRMRAGVPGPDVSSRRMIDPFVAEDQDRPGAVPLPG